MNVIKTALSMLLAVAMTSQAATVLCIGINNYDQYPDLKRAENDARAMASAFSASGDTVTLLIGAEATMAAVEAALKAKPDYIYFAGHGEEGRLMLPEGPVQLAAIATSDTMLVLDCCYIGRGLKKTGTMKILAASEHEAFERDGHGLFTKHLLDWLTDGKSITDAALTRYLEKNIRADTGGWQKPVLGFI